MAPVVARLRQSSNLEVLVCVTAQHREMLDQVLGLFNICPDYDLDLMRPNQTLASVTEGVVREVTVLLDRLHPDLVLVHGDTTTAFASALACFYRNVEVAHVEAGLRSGDMQAPWPEEMNRRFVGQLASLHFAPTSDARTNLEREGIPNKAIWVTGNTVVDSLKEIVDRLEADEILCSKLRLQMPWLENSSQSLVLVTGHRRESFGNGFESVCRAIRRLAREKDVKIVYPVHPNPNVVEPVHRLLGKTDNIHLIEPLDYMPFVYLMSKSQIILTDSGGIQEEAPSLGKPVLVMRETTERKEAVAAGTVLLVGVDENRIFGEAMRLLNDTNYYKSMANAHNPYGDGHASDRIVAVIEGESKIHEFS